MERLTKAGLLISEPAVITKLRSATAACNPTRAPDGGAAGPAFGVPADLPALGTTHRHAGHTQRR